MIEERKLDFFGADSGNTGGFDIDDDGDFEVDISRNDDVGDDVAFASPFEVDLDGDDGKDNDGDLDESKSEELRRGCCW